MAFIPTKVGKFLPTPPEKMGKAHTYKHLVTDPTVEANFASVVAEFISAAPIHLFAAVQFFVKTNIPSWYTRSSIDPPMTVTAKELANAVFQDDDAYTRILSKIILNIAYMYPTAYAMYACEWPLFFQGSTHAFPNATDNPYKLTSTKRHPSNILPILETIVNLNLPITAPPDCEPVLSVIHEYFKTLRDGYPFVSERTGQLFVPVHPSRLLSNFVHRHARAVFAPIRPDMNAALAGLMTAFTTQTRIPQLCDLDCTVAEKLWYYAAITSEDVVKRPIYIFPKDKREIQFLNRKMEISTVRPVGFDTSTFCSRFTITEQIGIARSIINNAKFQFTRGFSIVPPSYITDEALPIYADAASTGAADVSIFDSFFANPDRDFESFAKFQASVHATFAIYAHVQGFLSKHHKVELVFGANILPFSVYLAAFESNLQWLLSDLQQSDANRGSKKTIDVIRYARSFHVLMDAINDTCNAACLRFLGTKIHSLVPHQPPFTYSYTTSTKANPRSVVAMKNVRHTFDGLASTLRNLTQPAPITLFDPYSPATFRIESFSATIFTPLTALVVAAAVFSLLPPHTTLADENRYNVYTKFTKPLLGSDPHEQIADLVFSHLDTLLSAVNDEMSI